MTFNDDYRRNQSLGTKSALGNKRQLTNQIAGKDASLFFSFLGRHRVVLNKGTDGCMESTFVIPQDGYVTKYGNECHDLENSKRDNLSHFTYSSGFLKVGEMRR